MASKQYELLFRLTAQLGPNFTQSFKNASQTMKLLQNDLRSADQKLKDVSAYQKQQTAVENSKRRVTELQGEYDKLVDEIGDVDKATTEQKKQLKSAETALTKAKNAVADEQEELERLSNTLREAGINTDNLWKDTNELRRQYERLEQSQKRVQEITAKQEANKQAISQTKAQLVGLTGTVTAVGAAIYAGPVKKAAEFQEQMSTVKSLVGSIDGEQFSVVAKQAKQMGVAYKEGNNQTETVMNMLAAKAKQMGATTKFTAKEAGEAMEYMAVAGWGADEMLSGISGIMNLAAASGAELGVTSDIVTDSIENFGLTAKDTDHYVDVLAQTARKSNTDVLKLGESYKYVSPVAKSMGYSIEDVNVALGLMANSGIKASAGGTALRTLLTNMAKPSDDMAQAMDDLGVSLDDGNGNMKTFHEVMLDLRKGFGTLKIPLGEFEKRMSDLDAGLEKGEISQKVYDKGVQRLMNSAYGAEGALKAQAAAMLAGKTGMSGLLAIANASDETFEQLTYDLNHAKGAAQEMADTKLDNLNGQITLLQSAWDGLQVELGTLLIPILTKGIKKFTEIVNVVNDFVVKNPEAVKTIGKIAAGFVGLKAAGLVAKLGFLEIQGGILSIQKGFAILKGIGISKFLGSITGGFLNFKQIGGGILNYFKGIKGATGGVTSAFNSLLSNSAIFTKISSSFGNIAGRIKAPFVEAGTKAVTFLLKPFSAVGVRLGSVLSSLGGIIARSPLGAIGAIIGKGFGKITAFLIPVKNAIVTMLGPLGKLVTSIFGPFGGVVGKILPIVGVITTIITVVQLVKTHLQEIRGFIQKTFGDGALEVFNKMIAVITNIGNTIKNVFSDGNIGKARNKIQEIFGDKGVKVFNTLVNILGTVQSAVANVIQFVTDHVVPVAEKVLQVIITSVVPGIVSFIQAAAPTIIAIIQNIVDFVGAIIPVIADFIAGLMPVISEIITFLQMYVLPIIGEIFSFITSIVLPAISAAIQEILPVVINVLQTLLPAIQTALTTIWNIVAPIIQGILQVVQAVMPVILSVVQSVIGSISKIIQNLMTILQGIIDFVTGVFTGNWSQAWEGIKNIFKGAVGGLGEIIKAPLRAVVSAVNTVIGGLNKLSIPDWVPGLGGKGIDIPLIPTFAKGTERTPDTFIAGEEGPELITNAVNKKVFTAEQTKEMLSRILEVRKVIKTLVETGVVKNIKEKKKENFLQQIPAFAKGTERTPDTFIAGEEGPELITNAANKKVFTAEQTKEMLSRILEVRKVIKTLVETGIIKNIKEKKEENFLQKKFSFTKERNQTRNDFITVQKEAEKVSNVIGRNFVTEVQTQGKKEEDKRQVQNLRIATQENMEKRTNPIVINVTNNPIINVKKEETSTVKEQLQQYDEELLEKMRELTLSILKEQREQEDRVAYV